MYEQTREKRNTTDTDLTVIIEPWATEFIVSPGLTFKVIFKSNESGEPEWDEGAGCIIVYGWSGSVYSAYLDGQLIDETHNALGEGELRD